jgi:hypothetical protein
MRGKDRQKRANFVPANEKAKSEVAAKLTRIAHKVRLGSSTYR